MNILAHIVTGAAVTTLAVAVGFTVYIICEATNDDKDDKDDEDDLGGGPGEPPVPIGPTSWNSSGRNYYSSMHADCSLHSDGVT